jgi:TRAP-type C4-dicarboxylate transport system substrate-binding protein
MKARKTIMTLGVVTLLALTACGGGASEESAVSTPTAATPSETPSETPTEEAAEETVNLTYASVVGEADSFAQQATWFMEQTTELSNGRIQWTPYWSGSLLGAADMVSGVQEGRADAGHVANVYAPQNLPLSQVSVPFLTTNGEAMVRTLEGMYETSDVFRNEWENQGMKVLAWGLVGNATVGVKEEVSSLQDLDGQSLRAVGLTGQALAELGVAPTDIAVTEVYESVQRGTVDGYAGLPFPTAVALKLPEVAPYNLETGMGVFAIVAVVALSKNTWDALPADLQEIMLEVSKEMTSSTISIVEAAGVVACDQLIAAGGSVTVAPDEEITAWKERVFEPLLLETYKTTAAQNGADPAVVDSFLAEFRERLTANEKESTFVDSFTQCASR